MAETILVLSWAQFEELRVLCEAINHAKSAGAGEGELKNTIVDAEWDTGEVKITLDI